MPLKSFPDRQKTIRPVTHKVRITLFIPSLMLYYLLISVYKAGKPNFKIRDIDFNLWSKKGGFINPKTGETAFEYGLTAVNKNSPSKITIFFKPLFGTGTKTKTGKVNNIAKVGTDIEVNSSYYELEDILEIIDEFLKQIKGERFCSMIDLKEGKILNLERHIRYHEDKEKNVRDVLKIIQELSATIGDYDVRDTVKSGSTLFYKISAPSFESVGFNFSYPFVVKTYRFDAFEKRNKNDALRHPKLEVYLGKCKKYPSVTEYEIIKNQLDEFLLNLCHFAGLENNDYVEDLYFKKIFRDFPVKYRPWKPEGYTRLHDTNAALLKESLPLNNDNMMRCLFIMSNSENGCITVKDLIKQSKIPERSAWRYIKYFKDKGIIETINEGITTIFFPSRIIWRAVKGAIQILAPFLKFGVVKLYGQFFIKKDLNLTCKEAEELKQLEKFGEINQTPIIVETKEQASKLIKDFKSLKIRRSVYIETDIRPLY